MITTLPPKKALNKAFLKVKPNRNEIENFKTDLIQLLDRTYETESEEFHKTLMIEFLKKTYYDLHFPSFATACPDKLIGTGCYKRRGGEKVESR